MNTSILKSTALASAFALAVTGAALAQGKSGHGSQPVPNSSSTGGSSGSAAIGGTSASSLGLGATSTQGAQTGSALGVAGSAASTNGNSQSRAAVHGNNVLNGQAMAQAHYGGTFSKSHTHCQVKAGSDPNCRTKTMAHQPGSKPIMSTTTSSQR